MLYLLKGIQTEWIKTRQTFVILYVVLCPLLLSVLTFLAFALRTISINPEEGAKIPDINYWEMFISGGYATLSYLFLPLFIVLLNTMLYAREHQGNMWKHLYALPVPRWSVFGAKSLYSVILLAVSFVLFIVFLTIAGYLVDFVNPFYKFSTHDNLLGKHLTISVRIFIGGLGIWAIHNWLSLRFKGVGVSMGLAIASIVVTPLVLMGESRMGDWIYVYPYLHAFKASGDFFKSDTLYNFVQLETIGSLCYFLVFLFLGYWEYSRNRHK
jgi:lantibiotic transport system permease protein